MPTYFADSWFFIALYDRRDEHHGSTRRILARRGHDTVFVTHDGILTEVLAYFAEEGSYTRGVVVEGIRHALRFYDVLPADRPLFLAALDRYSARPDKEYSLVDCMSMIVMEERGIRHVLSNDHHFSQAGFHLVNE